MLTSEHSVSSLLQSISAQCGSAAVKAEEPSTEAEQPWSLPGFGAGAIVTTAFGYVPVEALRLHDPVKTRDGRFLEVKHVDKVRLDRRFLLTHPDAQPIAIAKNGLAAAVPNNTVLMSGCQKIRSPGHFDQLTGKPAVDYVDLGRAERKYHGYFTYHVFHCGEPCVVNINGLWVDLEPDSLTTPRD